MNPTVDWFFEKSTAWQKEYQQLRKVALSCDLVEELKWGCPCYTYEGANVVLIHGFKEYCALLFMKGALLKDKGKILIQQTKNVQSARQIRFTNVREITSNSKQLKAYIIEAIEVEKAGLKVKLKKTVDFFVPEEFQAKLNDNPDLKAAFDRLTPGRQRAYLFYFSQAKQAKTRDTRVAKSIPRILIGKGLDDD